MPSNIEEFVPHAQHYKLVSVLGTGASGTVFKAIYTPPSHPENKQAVAIKAINLDKTALKLESLQSESKLLSQCSHANIVGYHCSFVHQQYLWLVMPVLEGNVQEILLKLSPIGFEEPIIATIMYDILHAIQYMDTNNQIHRDLKSANILLDATGVAKLADFGVSAFLQDDLMDRKNRNTFVGSPLFMAPEVIAKQGYDTKADIWSFGICLIELAQGSPPYQNLNPMEVLINILQKDPPRLSPVRLFSKNFREVIELCLVKNPRDRASAAKLLECKFFQKRLKYSQIVESILTEYKRLVSAPKSDAPDERVVIGNKILHTPAVAVGVTAPGQGRRSDDWDFTDTKRESQLFSMIEEEKIRLQEENMKAHLLRMQEEQNEMIRHLQGSDAAPPEPSVSMTTPHTGSSLRMQAEASPVPAAPPPTQPPQPPQPTQQPAHQPQPGQLTQPAQPHVPQAELQGQARPAATEPPSRPGDAGASTGGPHFVENDVVTQAASAFSALFDEIKRLRAENTQLRESNDKLRRRILLFSAAQNKEAPDDTDDDTEGPETSSQAQ